MLTGKLAGHEEVILNDEFDWQLGTQCDKRILGSEALVDERLTSLRRRSSRTLCELALGSAITRRFDHLIDSIAMFYDKFSVVTLGARGVQEHGEDGRGTRKEYAPMKGLGDKLEAQLGDVGRKTSQLRGWRSQVGHALEGSCSARIETLRTQFRRPDVDARFVEVDGSYD